MGKFELILNNMENYAAGNIKGLMYQIKGDTELIKKIVCNKFWRDIGDFLLKVEDIKTLNIYVMKTDKDITEVWFVFDETRELCLITISTDLGIDEVDKIKSIVVDWLLG